VPSLSSSIKKEAEEPQRLLAYRGMELKPVNIEKIAFIYTQHKISYIVESDKKTSTMNTSLDDLYNMLDKNLFYRASRQVIVSAKAIDKIEKYGNTQLRVTTVPACPVEIVISKAKLTEFKKWAGQN
jgi:DNA-binding LytR/AlgR family response regulator